MKNKMVTRDLKLLSAYEEKFIHKLLLPPSMSKAIKALDIGPLGMAKPSGHCASLSLRALVFLACQG